MQHVDAAFVSEPIEERRIGGETGAYVLPPAGKRGTRMEFPVSSTIASASPGSMHVRRCFAILRRRSRDGLLAVDVAALRPPRPLRAGAAACGPQRQAADWNGPAENRHVTASA